jgi:uncharacterized membrane protein YgaE (UPF0421/DUF939 family)
MEREKNLETILSIAFGLVIIYWVTGQNVLIPVTLIIISIGLFSNYLAGKIHWFWMKLSHVMGYVMSRVILAVVFYCILFPISLLAKIFTKSDSLQLKRSTGNSYYNERRHVYDADDLENPW